MSETVSNADILREVRAITKVTNDHEDRIKVIEHYKTTQEAVAEYVNKFGTAAQKESNGSQDARPSVLASTIVKLFSLFAAIIAILGLLIQSTK